MKSEVIFITSTNKNTILQNKDVKIGIRMITSLSEDIKNS